VFARSTSAHLAHLRYHFRRSLDQHSLTQLTCSVRSISILSPRSLPAFARSVSCHLNKQKEKILSTRSFPAFARSVSVHLTHTWHLLDQRPLTSLTPSVHSISVRSSHSLPAFARSAFAHLAHFRRSLDQHPLISLTPSVRSISVHSCHSHPFIMPSSPSFHLFNQPGLLSMSPEQQQQLATQFLAFLQQQQQLPPADDANTSPSPTPLSNPVTSLPTAVVIRAALPASPSTGPASNGNDNLLSIPPPESPPSNGDNSDEEFSNTRFALNKAMGVDPTNRVAVQARRKAVIDFCLEFNKTLDKTYREWTPKSWRLLLNAVAAEFHQRYGWTRETCDKVMKCICSDTARNRRGQAKRDQLRAQQSGDASPPIVSEPRIALPIKKKPPPLRKPARKKSELAVQSSSPTPSSPSSSAIVGPQSSVNLWVPSPENTLLANVSTIGLPSSGTTQSHMQPRPEHMIAPLEILHAAPHSPYMIQLRIWKAGMVFWDRRQTFDVFSDFVNVHLPIRDTDTEVWIGKCNDWREWKPIVFESNYLNAMGPLSTHMHIKIVPSSWIGNEDEDYIEDLSVCSCSPLLMC
jgi:hypothetical protein